MTEDRKDILWEVFNQMPSHFSSDIFSQKLKKKGISHYEIKTDIMKKFLLGKAIKTSRRSWSKVNGYQLPLRIEAKNKSQEYDQKTIQSWIDNLKAMGMKVMKPKDGWEEI